MKCNVKGLVFVGFAAAILSANAMAATGDEKIVTSKAFTEATYQAKTAANNNGKVLKMASNTAGDIGYMDVDTTVTANSSNLVTSGAVSTAIANQGIGNKQGKSTADWQVGNSTGGWQQINPDSYVSLATNSTDSTKVDLTIAATTDTTLANAAASTGANSGDYGKLVTAGAVKTYVDNTANAKVENSIEAGHTTVAPSGAAVSTALSGKQGNLGGTANQIPVTTANAGTVTYKNIATASSGIATGEATIPTSGAVADAISGAIGGQDFSAYEVKSDKAAAVVTDSTSADYNALSTDKYASIAAVTGYAAPITTTVKHTNNTVVGSATQPVYIAQDGTATATSYALNMTVPAAPETDGANKVLAGNGTWKGVFTGANGTNAGTTGLVTAPGATDNTKFLKGDGTWAVPTDTTYTADSTTITLSNGQFSATTGNVASDNNGLVTGATVYSYVNGKLIPTATDCSASTPCALVATGTNTFVRTY